MTTHTSVSLDILESCADVGLNCSLTWELEDDDNDNPNCYLIGTSYLIRLYEHPGDLDVLAFNTNGAISYLEDITEEIEDEYIIFSGSQTQNLSKPAYSNFSFSLIGSAYGVDGTILDSINFTITLETKQIMANVPCYAVIRVNYSTQYSSYRFTGASEGKLLLGAIATCIGGSSEEDITATTEIDIWESCADEDEDNCLNIEIKIDTESEEGSAADARGDKLIRVWGATIDQINYYTTLGSVTFQGSEDLIIEEELSGCGADSFNASERIHELISQNVTSGNLLPFHVEDGELVMAEGGETIGGIPPGYGSVNVRYVTRFLKFLISSSRDGKGAFLVNDITYDECEITCITFEIGEEAEEEELYDITVIYKDFVTGSPIEEARVWVDDEYVGQTNENGEVTVEQIRAGKKYLIRASRPGYLNTESDSLSNDAFMIPKD